jgi:hypothetical protein
MRTLIVLLATCFAALAAEDGRLKVSVFATAPDIEKYLSTPAQRAAATERLKRLGATRVFLEGRLKDDYIPPERMRVVRDDMIARGFEVAGALDFVPGEQFGVKHTGKLSFMNYESRKTREDLAAFFRQQAPLFEEIIIDDSFCTDDRGPESERARGNRSWSEYRMRLMTRVLEQSMLAPARAARPGANIIVKYPQWYDRFHLFGYDPARMSQLASRVWVGTEVRDPKTPRFGYVQPTEGYINFRWIASVAGAKVEGAWFDFLDCSARNFIDQAYQSVLAGAHDLTFWHLEPVMENHPGNALFAERLDDLRALAAKVRGRAAEGIAYYKPVASASDENMYLADYLAMLGLPVAPVGSYPDGFRVAFLGVQAAADPQLAAKMRRHLAQGATLIVTPALLRRLGRHGVNLAGVAVSAAAQPTQAAEVFWDGSSIALSTPLDVEREIRERGATVLMRARAGSAEVPLVASRAAGKGRVMMWNVRTFSEADFEKVGEVLLPPRPLGLASLPEELSNELRRLALSPLGVTLEAPAGVAYYILGGAHCLYNFQNAAVDVKLNKEKLKLPANGWLWK